MHFTAAALLAVVATVNAVAVPNYPTTTAPSYPTTTPSKPTTTPSKPTTYPSKPTTTKPYPPGSTGSPCGKDADYYCTSEGLVNLLNCVNILSGNTISVPISLPGLPGLLPRDLEERNLEERTGGCGSDGPGYCCTSKGLINALNCVNIGSGNTITIPISL